MTRKYHYYIDLAARLYLAYMLAEYGVAKLTGDMFYNVSPEVQAQPMQDVSLFHLTWYFFQRQVALSYFVGIVQLVAAAMLIFNRTALIGVILALPVMLNVVIIDFSSLPTPHLGVRTLYYSLLLVGICIYRRMQVLQALLAMLQPLNETPAMPFVKSAGIIMLFAGLLLVFELLLMTIFNI